MIIRIHYNKIIEDYINYVGYKKINYPKIKPMYIYINTTKGIFSIHHISKYTEMMLHDIKQPYDGLKMLLNDSKSIV